MNMIVMFIMMALGGVILGFIGGFFTGGLMGMIMGVFAGIMPFMAIMQIIGYAKSKGFLALFKTLEENEKYVFIPNKLNKIIIFIMKIKHPEILYRKGLGFFEDKGTEFGFGNSPMSFAFPDSAYTVDFKTIQYFSLLGKDKDLEATDYEDCVKEYLGEDAYKTFCTKFRNNPKPDYYDIQNELDYLMRATPVNKLEKTVFGETVDFRSRLKFLKYNYNPITADNATEREKIAALKEGMDYKDKDVDKAVSRARAIFMVLMGLMIFLIVISVIDWSNFSSLFGLFGG